jgi:pimeloyl-ACP methyl ester carboxylesterase
MADDTAALLRHLGIEKADVFGYSMGGGVALQIAIRHPEVVRKLVATSASYTSDGIYPEVLAMIETITPEAFAGTPWFAEYARVAPNPDDFPELVAKLKRLDAEVYAWPSESVQAIAAPTLLVIGDSDVVRREHAVELFRLRGGGVSGDLAGLPNAQLAVLPAFLEAPMPETE